MPPKKNQDVFPVTPVGQQFTAETSGLLSTPRSVRTDGGQVANDDVRYVVAQNMNTEVLECDMKTFIKNYGASEVKPDLVTRCKAHLRKRGYILADGTWRDFQVPPSIVLDTENDCFSPLGDIVEEMFAFATSTGQRKNRFVFKMVPDTHLSSDVPGSNHKMDACIVEEDLDKGPYPNHILLMPIEAKKGNLTTDTKVVREQLVGDCHHIFADDPRRMFIYGITIVSIRMTMWYFSRSHSIKVSAFDWMHGTGVDTFIHLMLSFALATPEGLGLDPKIHKVPAAAGEAQQYVYEAEVPLPGGPVQPSSDESLKGPRAVLRSDRKDEKEALAAKGKQKLYFKTRRIISRERPLCITGRMTRIWVVRQVENLNSTDFLPDSEEVILKDVWIDSEEDSETERLRQIFLALDAFVEKGKKEYPGPDSLKRYIRSDPRFQHFNDRTRERIHNLLTDKKYRSLFLTMLYEWEGLETKPRAEGLTKPTDPVFITGVKLGSVGSTNRTLESGAGNPTQRTLGTRGATAPVDDQGRRGYVQKRQRRFIYKEVCTPSYKLETFGDLFHIIREAITACELLYCAGWVHRDISLGNLLATATCARQGEPRFALKLSDFEFAQKSGATRHRSDPRTGTPFFMPVEIMARRYLLEDFRIQHDDDDDSSSESDETDSEDADAWNALRKNLNESGASPRPAAGQPKEEGPENQASQHEGGEPDVAKTEDNEEKPVTWGIPATHPLYDKLQAFSVAPAILPVPKKFTLDIPTARDVVSHNYQHDLESIWWVMVYAVTNLASHEKSEKYTTENQWFAYNTVPGQRHGVLFAMMPAQFAKSLRRELRVIFPEVLEKMRNLLYTQYLAREMYGNLKDDTSYSYIHGQFANILDVVVDSIPATKWGRLELKNDKDTPAVHFPTNRGRSKRQAGADGAKSGRAKRQKN